MKIHTCQTTRERVLYSVTVHNPSSERGYFTSSSHQSVAQTPHSAAAETPTQSVQRGYSPSAKTSSLFSAVALPPQQTPVKMQTSASAPARRVISKQRSKASLPTRLKATQPERAGYKTSQAAAGKPYQSRLFAATGGSAQGSYKTTSSHVSYPHSVPASYKQNAPVSQRLNSKPSYTSTNQIPSRASSVQALGRSMKPAQGARDLPAGNPPQRFAPTKTYNIPQRFGGFPIRRLKDPEEEEAGVQKPQSYTTSPPPTYRPQVPQQAASYRPQVPQQAASYRPQVPQQAASYMPQTPQGPQASQQAASYRPQAPSVHKPSTWKRIKPGHSRILPLRVLLLQLQVLIETDVRRLQLFISVLQGWTFTKMENDKTAELTKLLLLCMMLFCPH
ncbi:hypothetical protein INR49_023818 [Caranx melampygus]|nr:hypothetical protein INR49_023818 [Caranx melampygus]